jgi:hypothetical protein
MLNQLKVRVLLEMCWVNFILTEINPAYDALVRLAQNFSLRYPLIDGQGNFGSRDGDGGQCVSYEARLTKIASLLLDEINQGTVDFIPNYRWFNGRTIFGAS